MAELRFHFDWEDPQGAKGPMLRATWARLGIQVGRDPAIRLFDPNLEAIRDYVWMPLYPLAEWIASNWWSLLFEAESAAPRPSFSQRHNLRFAGEGFALPDVSFTPLGDDVQIQWWASTRPDWPGEFIGRGSDLLPRQQVEDELRRVVEAVLHRVEQSGISDSYLAQEWARIQQIDEEESAFCQAAASLGLDPFSIDPEQSAVLTESHEVLRSLPGMERAVEWEFLQAADPKFLLDQVEALRRAHAEITARAATVNGLGSICLAPEPGLPPWSQGYQMARQLRDRLGSRDRVFRDFEDLKASLSSRALTVVEVETCGLSDAICSRRRDSAVAFGLSKRKQHDEMRAFALSRAVGEMLVHGTRGVDSLGIVTASQTEHQKRNRAFAAEFLAPSDLLRQRLNSNVATTELIDDLAIEFSVSPLVIVHQLENHQLVDKIER